MQCRSPVKLQFFQKRTISSSFLFYSFKVPPILYLFLIVNFSIFTHRLGCSLTAESSVFKLNKATERFFLFYKFLIVHLHLKRIPHQPHLQAGSSPIPSV